MTTYHAAWPTWRERYEHLIEPLGYRAALAAWLQGDQSPADLVDAELQQDVERYGRTYAAAASEATDLRVSLAMVHHGDLEVV